MTKSQDLLESIQFVEKIIQDQIEAHEKNSDPSIDNDLMDIYIKRIKEETGMS